MFRCTIRTLVVVLGLTGVALAGGGQDGTSDKLKTADDIKAVAQRLDRIEELLKKLVEQQTTLAMQSDIRQLRDSVEQVKKEVAELRTAAPARGYESKKLTETPMPPATMPSGTMPPGPGSLQLVNERLDMNMDMLINGQTFLVGPGQSLVVQLPAGAFTYVNRTTDVVARMSMIQPGETKRLTMR